jgi:hypothetical protein
MFIRDDLGSALTENASPGRMKAYSEIHAGHNTSVGRTRASLFHETLLMSNVCVEARKEEKMQVARMHKTTGSNDLAIRLRHVHIEADQIDQAVTVFQPPRLREERGIRHLG